MTPLIAIRNLVKRYGDKTILDGVDLTIERGETVVIIGGSGSGKSTLAKLLVGLERPTSGSILLEGVDLTTLEDAQLAQARHRFAMVFQRHALLDSMSVFDNVAFPLRESEHLSERVVHEKVTDMLAELGLERAAEKLPGELSGGMAKRVGIARALVVEPEILVYDEPTSGLDPVTSRVVDSLIERMRSQHLVTSVVITHDMITAHDVSDRIALLSHGKIVANDAPERIFDVHEAEMRAFAESSGMDFHRPGPRSARKPAAAIRAEWERRHAEAASPRRHRFWEMLGID
ncbi:MAG: ATP-binding cassette domain-containing protein [Polyangiaceae bacterium]|nr:ATP-binding cassette domain-containing protein [Polyangiaceae bacterium]